MLLSTVHDPAYSPTDASLGSIGADRRTLRNSHPLVIGDVTSRESLGLTAGLRVRFRRPGGSRWHIATVERVERDGSLGLRDQKGAARAIPMDLVEVATTGPRGARTWEPALERAARTEQLRLL